MRRIKLVLALGAVMVASLVAASPAHAIGDATDMPADGLGTANYVTSTSMRLGGPDTAIDVVGDLGSVGDPQISPGYGIRTSPPPDSD